MPPKKKSRLLAGQQTLSRDLSLSAPSTSTSSASDGEERTHRRGKGDVSSWHSFAERRWMDRHPWIDIGEDGVYCRFCRNTIARGTSQSGRATFITEPYTGTRPYHLSRHEGSSEHKASTEAYSEMVLRAQTNRRVEDTIQARGFFLTVDGDAFCDALRCLHLRN